MSGRMHIHFAADMPPAAVEVVGPDLESVGRVWLKPNGQTSLQVPSEASFLRVHLPTGKIVTLPSPGNLDRSVSYADILARLPPPPAVPPKPPQVSALPPNKQPSERPGFGDTVPGIEVSPVETHNELPTAQIKGITQLGRENFDFPTAFEALANPPGPWARPRKGPSFRLAGGGQAPAATETGALGGGGAKVAWQAPPAIALPYELAIELGDLTARVRLPGRLARLDARSEHLEDNGWKVVVRVRTTHEVADTVGGYLNRGDLHSAATLAASAETAEDLLQEKVEDPFAAVVGAYLLLRLRRLDLLHDWTYNLAMMYPEIPDVQIIRGWHLVQAGASQRETEIRACFAQALAGPLPIFTEGLQLLSEGARLLGKGFKDQLEALNARCGVVQWSSPFTATTLASGEVRSISTPAALTLDVDYF